MNIANQILTNTSTLVELLGNYDSSFVGYVYGMRFDEALVLTNDKFKQQVRGIPHNSFLIAAGFDPQAYGQSNEIDREIILLRVLEPVSIPQDNDYIRARIEHHQQRTSAEKYPVAPNDGYDPISANELQSGGLKCSILGTFYIDEDSNLRLGSDIENFMSLSRMRVYKPQAKALTQIINHVNPEVLAKAKKEALKAGFTSPPSSIDIGTVRYTSTARMHRASTEEKVSVRIQPTDFLARRTAVLGMTRTGKSNTVKTTVSAVAVAAMKDNLKVGQLIFDINGEYANATSNDDDSSIASVFPNTIRYRTIPPNIEGEFKDLRINFYQQPDVAISLLEQLSREKEELQQI